MPAVHSEVSYSSLAYGEKCFIFQMECFMPITEMTAQSQFTKTNTLRLPALLKNMHYIIRIFGLGFCISNAFFFFCKIHFNQPVDI